MWSCVASAAIALAIPPAGNAKAAKQNPEKLLSHDSQTVLKKLTPMQAAGVLPSIAGASSDPAIAKELEALPESNVSAGARHDADKAVEDIGFKSGFKARLVPAVSNWLKGQATN